MKTRTICDEPVISKGISADTRYKQIAARIAESAEIIEIGHSFVSGGGWAGFQAESTIL